MLHTPHATHAPVRPLHLPSSFPQLQSYFPAQWHLSKSRPSQVTSRRSQCLAGSWGACPRRCEPLSTHPPVASRCAFWGPQMHKVIWKEATSVCITVGKYDSDLNDYKSTALHVMNPSHRPECSAPGLAHGCAPPPPPPPRHQCHIQSLADPVRSCTCSGSSSLTRSCSSRPRR